MGEVHKIQTSFNAGIMGEKAYARIDIDKYDNGARDIVNFIPSIHGALLHRPPFRHIGNNKSNSGKVALIPFEFNDEQTYELEVGNNYIRFYKDKGLIVGDGALTTVTINTGGSGYIDGETVTLENSGNSWAQATATVSAGAITALTITTAGSGFTVSEALTVTGEDSGATNADIDVLTVTDDVTIELATDIPESKIYELSYTQSADVLFLFHRDNPIKKITRFSHTDWTIENYLLIDGPYFEENETATTLTAGAASGTGVSLTASATTGINGDDGFKSTDVGRLVRLRSGTSIGYGVIASYSSPTSVTIDIEENVPTGATKEWRLGSFSDTTGYPAVGTFYEQRLGLASTNSEKQKFFLSRTGLFDDFSPTDLDNERPDTVGFNYNLDSDKANTITWMKSGQYLMIGTIGEEWKVSASRSTEAVTYKNVSARPQTTKGSTPDSLALQVDESILFLSRSGRKVWDLFYRYEKDGYTAEEISLLAHSLMETGGGVKKIVYQKEPNSVVWALKNDGTLLTCTFDKDQKVLAWTKQEIGGTYKGSHPIVEDVSVISNPNAFGDEVWITVLLEVNGSDERHIMVLDDEHLPEDTSDKEEMVFLDNYSVLDNSLSIVSVTNANPCVVEVDDASSLSDGDQIIINSVEGTTELNGVTYTVNNKSGNTFELQDDTIDTNDVDSTSYGTYIQNGVVRKKVTTISGLDYLEGYEVGVLGDGIVQANQTVTSGSITLTDSAGLVYVGLPYEPYVRLLQPEGGNPRGTSQAQPQRYTEVTLYVYKSIGGSISTDGTEYFAIPYRTGTDKMRQSPALRTEKITLSVADDYLENGGDIRIKQTQPYPLNILSVMWESVVY